MLLLVLSLAIVNILLYPAGHLGHREVGGWSFVAYLLFFIFGYLIFANPRIMETVKRLTWITLAMGAVLLCALGFFVEELAQYQIHTTPVQYTTCCAQTPGRVGSACDSDLPLPTVLHCATIHPAMQRRAK